MKTELKRLSGLQHLSLIRDPMPTRLIILVPYRILAIQSGLAILSVVVGASELVDAVRWALPMTRYALLMVMASWACFLVNLTLFLVAVCGRLCTARTAAALPEGTYGLVRHFAIVVASLVLAVVAYCGIIPLVS